MTTDSTIAAISTPPGTGAIAIVRLSGPDAFEIAQSIFRTAKSGNPHKQRQKPFESHLARHGFIVDSRTDQVIDEVVLIPYRAPKTYTGEDLVEINCHGGSLISREILEICLKSGARLARPGEFTQRAFLSGRIDLTQAEAVLDLIQSKTSRQGRSALSVLSGDLGRTIGKSREELIALLTRVIAGIDFPEEVGDLPFDDIEEIVNSNLVRLKDLSNTARSGKFLRDGIKIALVGRPNAGKSSLLNQLLKFERAIVTDIPGTTRDSLEELIEINGVPVILVDTAGVRETDDLVEKMGIERTRSTIENADLVLSIVDLTCGWGEAEEELSAMIGSRPAIIIGNKLDLKPDCDLEMPAGAIAGIKISAKTGEGMPDLHECIENWVFKDSKGEDVSLNSRQAELCLKAVNSLVLVQKTIADNLPHDCLATDLKSAVDALSEICGESVSEEVISEVFASFCIGK